MVMAIDDFKSIVKDVARPNRFLVQIIPNPSVWEAVGDQNLVQTAQAAIAGARVLLGDPRKWFFVVKGIQTPARSLNELSHKRFGATRKFAGDVVFDDLSVTFLNDSAWVARSLMDSWIDQINNIGTNQRQFINKYAEGSTIIVEQMAGNNLPSAIWTFWDVWPKTIDASELNMDTNDTASEFTVQFAYNSWTRIL